MSHPDDPSIVSDWDCGLNTGEGGSEGSGGGSGGGSTPPTDPEPEPEPEPLEVDIVGLPDVAVAGASYELLAESGDDEGLAYAWRVDGGTIVPDTGPQVTWTAPDEPSVAWIHVDVTSEDGRKAEQSAYQRVEAPAPEPEPEPEPVSALPLLGQLLLALGLLRLGVMRLSRRGGAGT